MTSGLKPQIERPNRFVVAIGLAVLVCAYTCYAGDVVLLRGRDTSAADLRQIQGVAEFYGVNVTEIDATSPAAVNNGVARLYAEHPLAVLVAEDALPNLNIRRMSAGLRRPNGTRIPVLVFGIEANSHDDELNVWSNGAIRACDPVPNSPRPDLLEIDSHAGLARNLAGWQLPAVASPACSMQWNAGPSVQAIITALGGTWRSATLVRVDLASMELYFAARMEPYEHSWNVNPLALPQVFSSMAPFFLFLDHAAGDYAWHFDRQYANFTVDDPWLTEPYGHISYKALLAEMEKHNFHTTIAFIPWNFDRSEPTTASLLRNHPERYSVCIHGNDHTHREFGLRATGQEQIAKIKQAIARMERFSASTAVPYDRIMVFPHSIAREETFVALKKYGFLATANSMNVPSDKPFPTDPVFLLRPYSTLYAGFPSLFRYSAEWQVRKLDIAIQLFLGNPVLFYGHEQLFDAGPSGFNKTADLVNQLKPDVQWVSLGRIARHLHLVRLRDDGNFDVRMISSEMVLENPTSRNVVFHVERRGEAADKASAVTVNDNPVQLDHSNDVQKFRVSIPAHEFRTIRAVYDNDLDVAREDVRKTSLYAQALRRASDFRDLYLSRSTLGQLLVRTYYSNRWDSLELRLEAHSRLFAFLFAMLAAFVWYVGRRRNKKLSAGTPPAQSSM